MPIKKITTTLLFLAVVLGANQSDIETKIRLQNQQVVQKAAEGLNEKLPQKIDRFTRLIKILPNKENLIYIYELNVPEKSDEEIAKEGEKRMQKPVFEGVCHSSQRFLKSGIKISYRYISAKTQKRLFQFEITQQNCPNLKK